MSILCQVALNPVEVDKGTPISESGLFQEECSDTTSKGGSLHCWKAIALPLVLELHFVPVTTTRDCDFMLMLRHLLPRNEVHVNVLQNLSFTDSSLWL